MSDLISDLETSGAALNPRLNRLRSAATEDSRRNPGSRLWIERSKALGYPFSLSKNSSCKVVFLDEPEGFLMHNVIRSWNNEYENHFPNKEKVVCTKFTISPDGDDWAPTGQPCLFCEIISQPKLVLVGRIYVKYDKPIPRKDNPPIVDAVKALVVDNAALTNTLLDTATSQICNGSLTGTVFIVSRDDKEKSPRLGGSWVAQTRLNETKFREFKKTLQEKITLINVAVAFAPMSLEDQMVALRVHKQVSDSKMAGEGYSTAEFTNYIVNGRVPPTGVIEAAAPGWKDNSLDSLLDIPAKSETSRQSDPLFDMDDTPTEAAPIVKPTPTKSTPAKAEPIRSDPTDNDFWQ